MTSREKHGKVKCNMAQKYDRDITDIISYSLLYCATTVIGHRPPTKGLPHTSILGQFLQLSQYEASHLPLGNNDTFFLVCLTSFCLVECEAYAQSISMVFGGFLPLHCYCLVSYHSSWLLIIPGHWICRILLMQMLANVWILLMAVALHLQQNWFHNGIKDYNLGVCSQIRGRPFWNGELP